MPHNRSFRIPGRWPIVLIGFLAMTVSMISGAQMTTLSVSDSVIEQRLVELALRGPQMEELQHQSKIDEYQLKAAKNSWTNLLTLSLNYNEQSLKSPAPTATYVYPRYFFGFTLPLGTLLSRTQVKAANEAVEIGKLNQEELRRQIRSDVISKYRQYKAQDELISLATGLMNDVEAALVEAKEKFRKNEITFDAYNLVLQTKNSEQARIINLKLQRDIYELELERMIGTSLESVLK